MEQERNGDHQPPSLSTSSDDQPKYRGVRKRKWESEIRQRNSRERIWLGSYDTPEKAARAFDAALYCLHGNGSPNFNFPHNPPEIPGGHSLSPQEIRVVASNYTNKQNITMAASSSTNSRGGCNATSADVGLQPQTEEQCVSARNNNDWSFLGMLDFDHFYPLLPPSQPPSHLLDDDNEDSQPISSLWSF